MGALYNVGAVLGERGKGNGNVVASIGVGEVRCMFSDWHGYYKKRNKAVSSPPFQHGRHERNRVHSHGQRFGDGVRRVREEQEIDGHNQEIDGHNQEIVVTAGGQEGGGFFELDVSVLTTSRRVSNYGHRRRTR